ncbi:MAG: hypothetical protein JKY34_02920 [Kordiimonadaceae bacterium]|nr:hypothetical protein [Kordiimonadaceae bacterium]
MLKRLLQTIKMIDRLLPALVFAFLLSAQGIVASGAADYITFPELTAPDGRTLTFADICNSSGEAGTLHDCAGCLSGCQGTVGAEPQPVSTLYLNQIALQHCARCAPYTAFIISRPETQPTVQRGPPAS